MTYLGKSRLGMANISIRDCTLVRMSRAWSGFAGPLIGLRPHLTESMHRHVFTTSTKRMQTFKGNSVPEVSHPQLPTYRLVYEASNIRLAISAYNSSVEKTNVWVKGASRPGTLW
jgi:hypothetical protein